MLIEGIIILVIGVILFAIQNVSSNRGIHLALRYVGVILIIIGIVLIILGILALAGIAFLSLGALYPSLSPLLHN